MTYSDELKAKMRANPASEWHGKVSGYTLMGCRCNKCRAAQTNYMRLYRAQRKTGAA